MSAARIPLPLGPLLVLLGGATLAAAPHAPRLPWWVTILGAAMLAWRGWAGWKNERLPRRWLLTLLVLAGMGGVYLTYRTILGRDAGVTLLVLFLSLKLMETRERRDAVVVTFLCYFLALTNFFYSQSMLTAVLMLATVLALTTALVGVNGPHRPIRESVRLATVLLAQGVPVMMCLFFLFPRVQGPMWGIPTDAFGATTGLSDSMAPGNISFLSQSDAVAFRARFEGEAPERKRLYWRGPVFWSFDGRTWRAGDARVSEFAQFEPLGTPIRYAVTIEPHERQWLFALEMAGTVPPGAGATGDFQLLSRRPVRSRFRYEMTSFLQYKATGGASIDELTTARELPGGFNPRTVALAQGWRRELGSNERILERAVEWFRRAGLEYTLAPPQLGRDSVGRVSVPNQARILRALFLGVRRDDAGGGRTGPDRDRLPGRRDQPGRRLHGRAPVRRPRLGRGVARGRRLGKSRSDRRRHPDAARGRARGRGTGGRSAAVSGAGRSHLAPRAPLQLGGGRELLEPVGRRL